MKPDASNTEFKRRESFVNSLRAKEETFRLLIEHSKDGIALTDIQGITLYLSPAAQQILGHRENEISGRHGFEYIHPEDIKRVAGIFDDFTVGKSLTYEIRIRHKDGNYRWIDVTTTNLLHVEGLEAIVSNFRDITEKKEHEREALLREKEIWNLANAMPQLAWIAEPDGRVIFYNERIQEYGAAVKEDGEWKWAPLVHPGDAAATEKAWRHSVSTRTIYSIEHRIQMRNGDYRYHLSRAYPHLNEQGEVIKWFGTATDIDEQKKAQQLLEQYANELSRQVAEQTIQYRQQKEFAEAILDSSVDVVAVYDTETRLVMANKNFFERFKLAKEEATGKKLSEIFPGGDEGLARLGKALAGESVFYPAFKSKFHEAFFESYIIPLKDNAERVYAALVIAHDVTSSIRSTEMLKQSAEQLKAANESLIKQNEELEQFAYVASHDLQEPLRKIMTFARMLERSLESPGDDARRYIQKIIQSSGRMSELIRDVLRFSQLNKADIFQTVDLNEILSSILTDLELLIDQKSAVIEHSPLPTIEAVPRQMTQLFYNLISNSLKFSDPEQPVLIRISCDTEPAPVNADGSIRYFRITFADNGIGFNQSFADKIFLMFQRLNTRELYSGSGIGLAMVKKIVSNHRGFILAEGEEGKGATFHVVLPERQDDTLRTKINTDGQQASH
jgi:PAS domain S-box-containing protein